MKLAYQIAIWFLLLNSCVTNSDTDELNKNLDALTGKIDDSYLRLDKGRTELRPIALNSEEYKCKFDAFTIPGLKDWITGADSQGEHLIKSAKGLIELFMRKKVDDYQSKYPGKKFTGHIVEFTAIDPEPQPGGGCSSGTVIFDWEIYIKHG